MQQNTSKTLGFKKIVVYKTPPGGGGGGGKPYLSRFPSVAGEQQKKQAIQEPLTGYPLPYILIQVSIIIKD